MRFANRALSAGGLLLAVTSLAACGSTGSLLTADQASGLKGQLNQVSQSLNAHACQQAANQITNFRTALGGLGSVNQTLVANLDQGATRLTQLAAKECPTTVQHPKTTTQTTTTQTATTPTTPTQTATTPTTPTQTATTTTPTQTTTTQTTTGPGSGGVGLNGGNGNGNGNGQAKDKGQGSGGASS